MSLVLHERWRALCCWEEEAACEVETIFVVNCELIWAALAAAWNEVFPGASDEADNADSVFAIVNRSFIFHQEIRCCGSTGESSIAVMLHEILQLSKAVWCTSFG